MAVLMAFISLSITAQTGLGNFPRRVILDTDANNEVDDQHAIAYLLLNGKAFDLAGITVNRTNNGGDLESQMAEAARVIEMCGLKGKVKLLQGADKNFTNIRPHIPKSASGSGSEFIRIGLYDGSEAVNFIIAEAREAGPGGLLLLPIGKLTNIALALAADPSIAKNVRILWLGSNYPGRGEYNQDNDEEALRYILDLDVPFDIALVRGGKDSGTDAVRVTPDEVKKSFAGLGPKVSPPVPGRNGGTFTNFGDYSVNLFSNIDLHGDPPSRALYDLGAVAIAKNPKWAEPIVIPAPMLYKVGNWKDRPSNKRTVILWENFNAKAIIGDFINTLKKPSPLK